MKVFIVALLALVCASPPAIAQAATADPAQQAFVAGILRFVGQAMLANADNWAGWLLLAFPPVGMIATWLMPREWLFALVKGGASPLLAIGKLVAAATTKSGK